MGINKQDAEKRVLTDPNFLDVVNIFHTIQGEGPYTGQRAVFIRLAGCNLQCPQCDTDYTSNRELLHVSEILDKVVKLTQKPQLVVITGGEPFRQNLTTLCNTLLEAGYWVQVETNGTLRPSPDFPDQVCIVCSPKGPRIDKQLAQRIDVLKYVLSWNSIASDGLPFAVLERGVGSKVARPPKGFKGTIYLQPMDAHSAYENKKNVKAVLDSCMEHGYTLQLQIHKLIGVE